MGNNLGQKFWTGSSYILVLLLVGLNSLAKQPELDPALSNLSKESQILLTRSGRLMKSGKYDKAKPGILSILEGTQDVQACLALAAYTEPYAFPLLDVRRQCLNKALSLCTTDDEFIVVALKSRKYQFFEITRQAISSLIQRTKTTPALYDLAHKAQEVALNDIAHLALEKAYDGLKTREEAFTFADECKALGQDDLLRKVLKQIIDDEDNSGVLCKLALKMEKYQMRDLNRYLLRKALDRCVTVPDMEAIQEVARRTHEPDVQERAQFFVRKGKLIQKIKEERAASESKMRSLQENGAQTTIDAAGFGTANPANKQAPGSARASTGF